MSRSVAIVTGASQDLGKATARRLARDFGAVVLVARGGEKLAEVGEQVKAAGAEPLVLAVDLTAASAAGTIVQASRDRFGRIDALVNIAGAVAGLDVFQMTDEQWNTGMVSPGAIMTGRRQAMLETAAAWKNIGIEAAKTLFLKQAGIGRSGEAGQIADVIAFAVSPAARWMTGTVLRMDGGEVKSI